jgi:cation transport regulator ChaC
MWAEVEGEEMIDESTFVSIPLGRNATAPAEKLSDWYFAYGSNMNLAQIRSRCSRPVVVAIARLADHRLTFYGHTETWDGAMETVEPTPGYEVWGVIFQLSRLDWERLDEWQGARLDGAGQYFHFPVTVTDMDGQDHNVRIYKKDVQGEPRDPSHEYLEHIAHGAAENGLPPHYVEALLKRKAKQASYKVPMRANSGLATFAVISCAECPTGAA